MGKNLELKTKVNSHDEFIRILIKVRAIDKGVLNQKDIYYKINNGLLKLRIQNGEFYLIKYLRDENTLTRWSNYEILQIKSKNAEDFLKSLFDIETVVEKERVFFLYKHTRIHLDKVKALGNFLELETVIDGISDQQGEEEFAEVVSLLKLDLNQQLKTSYRTLLINKPSPF